MSDRQTDWLAGGTRRDLALRAIHAAAHQQLLAHGLPKFTAEAVARRAGCSRATLYRIAGGKKALLDAVMAQGAAEITTTVAKEVAHLDGSDRVIQAVLVGLRALRANPAIHAWVRDAAVTGDLMQSPESLTDFVNEWTGERPLSPLARLWVLRVFLQFVAWPEADAGTEAELLRQFVGPALALSPPDDARSPVAP